MTRSVPAKLRDTDDGGTAVFDWDQKMALLYLPSGTDSFQFEIIDKDTLSSDDVISRFNVGISELPALGEDWVTISRTSDVDPDKYPALKGAVLTFKIRVAEGCYFGKDDVEEIFQDTDTIQYREHILDLASGDHAVAQAWTHIVNANSTGDANSTVPRQAALWVIGRNDGFAHPHVAKQLFLDKGVDLFLLNWHFNGLCLRYGFIKNPYHTTHNPIGEINMYNEELQLMMALIKSYGPYDSLLGYAHSMGGKILVTNYIIEMGDGDFDAFVLNSPFLDWDEGTAELLLDNYPDFQANLAFVDDPEETPEIYKDDPVLYSGQSIVPNDYWPPTFTHCTTSTGPVGPNTKSPSRWDLCAPSTKRLTRSIPIAAISLQSRFWFWLL